VKKMDLSKVKPLDIEKYLGKVKNRVALVGVELEGGWVELPKGVAALEHDGSVFNGRIPAGVKYIGELPIGPALPAGIAELIRVNHPQKVNNTCGMHVHMSFDTLWYYHLLMVPEYQETILEYLTRWAIEQKIKESHCIWSRLKGESRYCRKEFWPDAQSGNKRKTHNMDGVGHRYTHVHYCGRQSTIEIRTLPMMDKVKVGTSAVQRVIDITNACLYVLGKKAGRNNTSAQVTLPDNIVYEETIIEQM
jgi:hypothetical protein